MSTKARTKKSTDMIVIPVPAVTLAQKAEAEQSQRIATLVELVASGQTVTEVAANEVKTMYSSSPSEMAVSFATAISLGMRTAGVAKRRIQVVKPNGKTMFVTAAAPYVVLDDVVAHYKWAIPDGVVNPAIHVISLTAMAMGMGPGKEFAENALIAIRAAKSALLLSKDAVRHLESFLGVAEYADGKRMLAKAKRGR